MSWRMMFSILRRNALVPALVLLQVAVACAILCNVLFLVWQRMEPMLAPSGIADKQLILIDHLNSTQRPWTAAEVRRGTDSLRQVPGVRAVSAAFGLPMVSNELMDLALRGPNGVKVGVNGYMGRDLVPTLGLKLVAGRDFVPSEYRPFGMGPVHNDKWDQGVPQPVIITLALADQLFAHGHALGKVMIDPSDKNDHGYQVVGIVQHLLRNQLGMATDGRADNTVLLARNMGSTAILSYAVRIDPAMRDVAMRGVKAVIHRQFDAVTGPDSPARVSFYSARRAQAFRSQRAALWLLASVSVAVVLVTLMGIMGLSAFWVQKRTRQIGIHRALGARRRDILQLFLAENALLVVAGVIIGMPLAYLGNLMLMKHYELPRLPWEWLPIGAALMLVLGQLAVLGPARRAAAVPPVIATRSL